MSAKAWRTWALKGLESDPAGIEYKTRKTAKTANCESSSSRLICAAVGGGAGSVIQNEYANAVDATIAEIQSRRVKLHPRHRMKAKPTTAKTTAKLKNSRLVARLGRVRSRRSLVAGILLDHSDSSIEPKLPPAIEDLLVAVRWIAHQVRRGTLFQDVRRTPRQRRRQVIGAAHPAASLKEIVGMVVEIVRVVVDAGVDRDLHKAPRRRVVGEVQDMRGGRYSAGAQLLVKHLH